MKLFIEFVSELGKRIKSGKKYVIVGYGPNGVFMEWMMKRVYWNHIRPHNHEILIVDDSIVVPGRNIYRRNLFDYLDVEHTIALVTSSEQDIEYLLEYGYEKNYNLFVMPELIGTDHIGFLEWLESKSGADLCKRIGTEEFDYNAKEVQATASGVSRQMALPDILWSLGVNQQDRVLDYGCGKGGAMVLMGEFGFGKVDGIEYSESISKIAKHNMELLNLPHKVFVGNAVEFKDISQYNYFYFYDPFRGDTFDKVIRNIEQSIADNPRKVTIIYANPWEHFRVVKERKFELIKQIDTDFFLCMVNIYESTK